jgi:methylglutaconyl-CoA hydratase
MFAAIDTLPVPVIAQIHGAALGGGAGLAAVADIAVAADDTTFGFTEVKLGLMPAVIAPYVIAKIGQSAARELFITGRRFDAAHARDIGLVHVIVPAEELLERVNKYLIELATNGPEAMSAAKALLREIGNLSIAEASSITAEAIAERRVSGEAQKLMKAFLKK